MNTEIKQEGTRWSGADWASEKRVIVLAGAGGIGSWLALNLARIGHELWLFDGDEVDETNVSGGQMFKHTQVGTNKTLAVNEICREFGCTEPILAMETNFEMDDLEDMTYPSIFISAVDNMEARKLVFQTWKKSNSLCDYENVGRRLFIDGRLTLEMFEIFAINGQDEEAIKKYEREYLFNDEEANILDCTTKQSTFAAMGIASFMTAVVCNHLTNVKLGMDFREVPFYQRVFFPIFDFKTKGCKTEKLELCQEK